MFQFSKIKCKQLYEHVSFNFAVMLLLISGINNNKRCHFLTYKDITTLFINTCKDYKNKYIDIYTMCKVYSKLTIVIDEKINSAGGTTFDENGFYIKIANTASTKTNNKSKNLKILKSPFVFMAPDINALWNVILPFIISSNVARFICRKTSACSKVP